MMKRMSYDEWAERLHQVRGKPDYDRWMGVSPGGAAAELRVSRQRISQLVKAGRLDMLMLSSSREAKVSSWLITDASLSRFIKSKPMQQQSLTLSSVKRRKTAKA